MTVRDAQVNGIRATNIVLSGVAERVAHLKKSQSFIDFLAWTEKTEKNLVGAQE